MLNQDEKRGRLMTKIVICGANGKMGHTVASCIAGRDDCTVVGGVDSYTEKYADFSIVATPAELTFPTRLHWMNSWNMRW